MPKKIMVLQAYSAHNRGDGLLVDETIALLRHVFGRDVQIEMCASDPQSFEYLGIRVYRSKPTMFGWSRAYVKKLFRLHEFDLIVGVGGGYLRAGHPVEFLKCLLVMVPQLLAAGMSSTPSVYLPQSIGPFRCGTRYLFRSLVRRISCFMLRDDRSMGESALENCQRFPDLALTSPEFRESLQHEDSIDVDQGVVLTARAVHGSLPKGVKQFSELLSEREIPLVGYIQSSVGGNNDTEVQQQLTGLNNISPAEFLRHNNCPPRVVVAVRLHAALMALKAGHFVIHLAYERKGFSAFADAGLQDWVHNVNTFDPHAVIMQVESLLFDAVTRTEYRQAVQRQLPLLEAKYVEMAEVLQASVNN
ncbi:MAG: polysaccharide pyruvyl transferase family protein [Corynebacterium sp.]|nr:polysaccharide pyruvyl transferase family protein [Corynebacterium sp.]